MRDLHGDARAVPRALIAAHAAAVLHVAQRREGLLHDQVVGGTAVARDEGETAGIVLVGGIRESMRRRAGGEGQ